MISTRPAPYTPIVSSWSCANDQEMVLPMSSRGPTDHPASLGLGTAPDPCLTPTSAPIPTHVTPTSTCPTRTTDLTIRCPYDDSEMLPIHSHYQCPRCGWRDSCCF